MMFGCHKEYRDIKGKIFYTESNKIIEFNLENRNKKIIYEGRQEPLFNFLNHISENLFILEVNHITEGTSIQYLDTLKGELKFIVEGAKPLYIAEDKLLFYSDLDGNLYQMRLDNAKEKELIASDVHTRSGYYSISPIRISDEELVYYTKDNKIAVYNFKKREIKILNKTNYFPLCYYKRGNALLCKNLEDEKLYFVSLYNQSVEKLSIGRVGYRRKDYIIVDKYNCIIYSKTKFFPPEYEDMYIYWIDSKKEQRYFKNAPIGSGIYVSD